MAMEYNLKYLPTILAILTLAGCDQPTPDEDTQFESQTSEGIDSFRQNDYEIVLIEGCQYIIYIAKKSTTQEYGYMSHKGNCNNPMHYYKTSDTSYDTLETAS